MDLIDIIENSLKAEADVHGEHIIVDKNVIEARMMKLSDLKEKDIPDKVTESSKPNIKTEKATIVQKAQKPFTPFVAPPKPAEKSLTIDADWWKTQSLSELNQAICNCKECELGETRNKFVFGTGNQNADIMIIGEAPGADEDEQGMPFVGRAGQLLTKILESVNLTREEVFIANIIKCRPPNNRRPTAIEVEHCEPYLIKQIELIKPQFILSLGLTSVDTLLKKSHKMGDIRGKFLDYQNIKMLVTYHPAALLRNPAWKKFVWEDVQLLRKKYDAYKAENN